MSIDLEPYILCQVQEVLKQHVPDCEVWAFGSRVSGRAKRFSDLDLAIVFPAPISVRRLALLANAFEESNLPIKVDLLDLRAASPVIQNRVSETCELIFRPVEPIQR
jgi:type I restriction enzyme S subunit